MSAFNFNEFIQNKLESIDVKIDRMLEKQVDDDKTNREEHANIWKVIQRNQYLLFGFGALTMFAILDKNYEVIEALAKKLLGM